MSPRRALGAILAAAMVSALATAPQAVAAPVTDPPGTVVFDPAGAMPGGLWLDGRRLVTGDAAALRQRSLGAPGPIVPGPWQILGTDMYGDFCNGTCYYVLSAGSKTAYVLSQFDAATSQSIYKVVIVGPWGVLREFAVTPSRQARLVAMTPSLLAYRVDDALKLYDIDNGHEIAFPRPTELQYGFALDGRRVWTTSTYGGPTLIGEDVDGGQLSVTLPEACPQFYGVVFKALNHWLAWGCNGGGFTLYRGVVDLNTGVNKTIYADSDPALGDGFLVWVASGAHEGGYLLQVIDFTKTPPVTTDLTTLDWGTFAQLWAWEGIRWAVDKAGGQAVAWVEGTEAGKIHVIPLAVPASPLRIYGQTVPATITPNFDGVNDVWHPIWEISKPAKWTLTLRRNGLLIRTLSGTSYGSAVAPEWKGDLRGWARWFWPAHDGVYTYSLNIMPADGSGPGSILVGSVQVQNSIAVLPPPIVPRKG